MALRYFFDLPVYRLREEKYYADRDAYIDRSVFQVGSPIEAQLRERERLDPRINDGFRSHLGVAYGGCWRFNEVIGQIRLHFLGTQVRGEYFSTQRQRVVRTRRKTFEYRACKLAPEVDVPAPYGTTQVLDSVRRYIDDCRAEVPGRHIDDSMFEAVAPYIDWGALFVAGLK